MKTAKMFFILAVLFCFVSLTLSGEGDMPEKSNEIAQKLKALIGKGESGENQKKKLIQERINLIKGLIDILKNEKLKPEARVRAAFLLGEYRAEKAVSALFDNLLLSPEIIEEKCPETISPCMVDLIKIGKKASIETLNRIPKLEQDMRVRRKYIRYLHFLIITRIEGKETAGFMIREKIKKLKGQEHKNAQAFLKKYFSEEK